MFDGLFYAKSEDLYILSVHGPGPWSCFIKPEYYYQLKRVDPSLLMILKKLSMHIKIYLYPIPLPSYLNKHNLFVSSYKTLIHGAF